MHTLRVTYALPILFIVCALPAPACAQDQTYDEWLAADRAAQIEYDDTVTRQYQEFVQQEQKAFDAFIEAAGRVWGSNDVWVPDRKSWVQYSEDLEERSGVDFEAGHARVQVVVTDESDPDSVKTELAAAVERLALSGTEGPIQMFHRRLFGNGNPPSTTTAARAAPDATYTVREGDTLWGVARKFRVSRTDLATANQLDQEGWLQVGQILKVPGITPLPAAVKPASTWKPSKDPLLRGQLQTRRGKPVSRANARAYAREVVDEGLTVDTVKGSDGAARRVASVSVPLVPNHVAVRAERFRPLVTKYAGKYGVYPPLIYALIETESSFNPRARSGVPAYGLMQLVPRSGARDAYRYVYKEDRMLPDTYLYDPRNNIELGCAFVHVLDSRYLKAIENATSRMFCTIAAYNTGAGNVARAFTEGRSVTRAAPIINSMGHDQVYATLQRDLPYEETRHYIEKVTQRMPQYRAWR
ncbi:MAG: DUF3393 domain-containing protein [Lentisphaerae bacterium]|nr:DUF3393 domain-containing protein [Lentisphaerota bacterium]